MSSWYFYVKIWWSKVKVIKGYNVCNVSINCRYILDNEDNSPWLENSLWHRQYYIAGALSEVWPGLQSLCARVVMVLSRSYLTNQWEQVQLWCPEGLQTTFISPMLQIETLTQSKCVIVLLDDLTSLDFASVPKLNSLLKQNVVLRLVLI